MEWKDGSDFEEPGDAVRPFEGGSAEPEGLASEAHRTPSPTVADLLNWADISVRLFNVSRISGLFGEWTISEALARRGEFLAGVLRVTNAGAKTVSEVSRLLDDVRDGRIVPPAPLADADLGAAEAVEDEAADLSDPRFDEFVVDVLKVHPLSTRAERILGLESLRELRVRDFARDRTLLTRLVFGVGNIGRKSLDEVDRVISAFIDRIRTGASADEVIGDPRSPRERLLSTISALGQKQSDVLRWRYGLDGCQVKTLQEIAEAVHVTRERVRQVEANALRRLQKGPAAGFVSAFIKAEQEAQWTALAGMKSWVDEDELSECAKAIDPLFRIAVDARFGSLRPWLDRFSTRTDTGWTHQSHDGARFAAVMEAVNAVARSRQCPMPLCSLGPEIGNDIGLLHDGCSFRGWLIFEGYLCVGYLGARVRRRVRTPCCRARHRRLRVLRRRLSHQSLSRPPPRRHHRFSGPREGDGRSATPLPVHLRLSVARIAQARRRVSPIRARRGRPDRRRCVPGWNGRRQDSRDAQGWATPALGHRKGAFR